MFRKLSAVALVMAMTLPTSASAGLLSFGLNEDQVKEIVKKYLEENPEVITEAQQRAQIKAMEERQANARKVLAEIRQELENDPSVPVLGNPKGDVTVVEFLDYNCGYCKRMFQTVGPKIKADGNIRWVLRDFPVLGPTSRTAALAGLAANKQGKFAEMHSALMTAEAPFTDESIRQIAKDLKLNMDKFDADIKSPELAQVLDNNMRLANKLEVRGIPQFIIGDFISQGAMMGNELEENVRLIRSKKK